MKKILQLICDKLGLFRLLFSLNKDAVIVFMLHGVVDDEVERNSPCKPLWKRSNTRELDIAIKALAPYVDFIDMDEVKARLSGNSKPKKPGVAFTFDDGYSNNITHAYPVLASHNAPMIIYFATGFLDKKLFWIDEIDFLLQAQATNTFSIKVDDTTFTFDKSTRKQLGKDYKYFRQTLRTLRPDERELVKELENVKQQLDPDGTLLNEEVRQNPYFKILTPDEVKSLPEDIAIGCHTVEHLRLDELDRSVIDKEINESKTYLELLTGQACKHFCYPVGAFNEDARNSVEQAGFETAVTTREVVNRPPTDLMLIDRLAFPSVESKSQLLFFVSRYLLKRKRS